MSSKPLIQQIDQIGRYSVAIIFICAGLISFIWNDHTLAINKLTPLNLSPVSTHFLFYGLIVMDILFGLLLLFTKNPIIPILCFCIVTGYTLVISFIMPSLLLDPFGILLKNIPILSWLITLILIQKERA
ncbi:DoxX-like family protein [Neisseria sp. Ec49-e6-T10]|uniref:DoxX-like family protein n=1 Tax=Neisseria sp. Ec49-e6-T10 TaxID=3140744 RepID=UPI003EC025E6